VTKRLHWLARKGWPLVVLGAACGAAIGYLIAFAGDPTYASKATLYVAPPISSSPTDAVMGDQYADNRTQLYLQLIESDELAGLVAAELQSSEPLRALTSKIDAIRLHQTPLLEIEAKGPSPEAARSLAQAYVNQLPEYARSVEQNSGLREGSVLIPVAGPTEATGSTTGLKPWLTILFSTVLFGCAALAYVIRKRHRNPTARNIGALRKAMPASFIEEVGHDPSDILRIEAMLFAAPHSARQVIFASARLADALETFTADFARSLQGAGVPCEHVKAGELDEYGNSPHSHALVVIDAPGLLDDSHGIAALAERSHTAVIVARRTETLVEDVVQLGKLLGLNGIEVKGVISVRRARKKGVKRHDALIGSVPDESPEDPWPTVDLLEAGMGSRNEGRTTDD
jgi:hypothetical protein